MISDDPAVVALGAARALTQQAMAGGKPGGVLDPAQFLQQYRAALRDCPLDRPALVIAHQELAHRLGVGLTRRGDDQAVGQLFSDLLYRYEAVEDMLDDDGRRRRLARWEVMIADMMIEREARGAR